MKLQLLIFLSLIIFDLSQSRPQQRDDLQKVQQQQQERQPRAKQSQIVTKTLQPPLAPSVARKMNNKVKSQRRRPKKSKPAVGIVRSVYNAPIDDGAFDFSYETENGIKQETVGTMKKVGDVEVVVMRGSYEYIGSDGLTYVVDWIADENGFQPSAPHLPEPVPIPFPEQQEAVEAQIRFAEEQKRQRANSKKIKRLL